jgi:hypothetical protein
MGILKMGTELHTITLYTAKRGIAPLRLDNSEQLQPHYFMWFQNDPQIILTCT